MLDILAVGAGGFIGAVLLSSMKTTPSVRSWKDRRRIRRSFWNSGIFSDWMIYPVDKGAFYLRKKPFRYRREGLISFPDQIEIGLKFGRQWSEYKTACRLMGGEQSLLPGRLIADRFGKHKKECLNALVNPEKEIVNWILNS